MAFWEDALRYLYLPRLKSRDVLAAVVRTGTASKDFFGTAYALADGKYEGFQLGDGGVSLDDALLLIEPEAAEKYAIEQKKLIVVTQPGVEKRGAPEASIQEGTEPGEKLGGVGPAQAVKAKLFRGSVEVNPTLAKSRLNTIADEIIALLGSDPNATIRVTLEIDAEFPNGASDTINGGVSENATSLEFKTKDWE